jgi:adenylate kinase family enzyme
MSRQRIVIYGPTGSGKTATARRMGELLALPVVELDALFWRRNWNPAPDKEFRARVAGALNANRAGWICDGNYTSKAADLILPKADLVVWLVLPFVVVYWRLLTRTVRRVWTEETLWDTNRESWQRAFLSRDSLLLWAITHWRQQITNVRGALREIPHTAEVIKLHSPKEVDRFLASLSNLSATGRTRADL